MPPLVHHLRTNVPPWSSSPSSSSSSSLAALDVCLLSLNATPVTLPWTDYEYLPDDREHFTRRGLEQFAASLAAHVDVRARDVYLLTDSTVDYHNWKDDGRRDGWADEVVRAALLAAGARSVRVDAVCGSGFLAGDCFGPRLLRAFPRRGGGQRTTREVDDETRRRPLLLLAGGWNDRDYPPAATCAAARRCVETFVRRVQAE